MIIPSELQFTAERLDEVCQVELEQLIMISTQSDSMGMIPQGYVVNNYLTDTDAYFIIVTDVPNGMKYCSLDLQLKLSYGR